MAIISLKPAAVALALLCISKDAEKKSFQEPGLLVFDQIWAHLEMIYFRMEFEWK